MDKELMKATIGDVKCFHVELKNGEVIRVKGGLLIATDDKYENMHLIHLNVDPHFGYSLLSKATKEVRKFLQHLK